MNVQLPPEIERRVVAAAKRESGQSVESVSVGRLFVFFWHCGSRTRQVKIFVKKDPNLPSSDGNRQRGRDAAVCVKCSQVCMLR